MRCRAEKSGTVAGRATVVRGCGGCAPIYILNAQVVPARVSGTALRREPGSHRNPPRTRSPVRMFDEVRQAFRDLLRGTPPSGDARRTVLAQMRETLVRARMGLDDLRKGVAETKARLNRERTELETVRRRKQLAQGINDAETVRIAERFEKQHADRVAVLERKLETQEAELALVEREVQEMNAEFKLAAAGATPGVSAGSGARTADPSASTEPPPGAGTDADPALDDEIDRLARARRRADADAAADEKLAALKRRMGK